jgi:hypothetical protein
VEKNNRYLALKKAYTAENLHYITTRIIESYRKKQYEFLRQIMHIIKKDIMVTENKVHKIFSRLIMLYHPDKLNYYKRMIENNHQNGDEHKLNQLSHILKILEKIDCLPQENLDKSDIVILYDEEYGYDEENLNFFTNIDQNEYETEPESQDNLSDLQDFDFISIFRQKEMGNSAIDIYYNDLESLEGDLELSDSRLDDLTGIEYCKNIRTLDLSNNQIADITNIGYLQILEELYLSGNAISTIDILSGLKNLRKVDLSFNHIIDVSAIFELPDLEYINLIGNSISDDQIDHLKKGGVFVIN